jgi:hypothetical protein
MRDPNKPFILVRKSPKHDRRFPDVVICDTRELVPAVIDGRPTRVYKPVSEVIPYLDAYPQMVALNKEVEQKANTVEQPLFYNGMTWGVTPAEVV